MSTSQAKTALITGVRGQDGSYLAEQLIAKGYKVIGTSHACSQVYSLPIKGGAVSVLPLDLTSADEIRKLIGLIKPDEVYNLAARSSSAQLFDDPIATAEINGVAVVRFLEAIRELSPQTRFCQAASSEIFVGTNITPQDENTPYRPINAYGSAKSYAANIVASYRISHGLFAATAILFNHESPRRGIDYVTRKITHAVARISLGLADELVLGPLESRRDWGFADDYARAMWLMMQDTIPRDYVIATGKTHSIEEFCEIAFSYVKLDYRDYVRINHDWERRKEIVELCGNSEMIKRNLGWSPSIAFAELVCMMVDADIDLIQNSN